MIGNKEVIMFDEPEQKILYKILEGKNNSQILTELGLSEETLEVYLKKLYSKMNVTNRLQVIIYCYNNNLIPHLLN